MRCVAGSGKSTFYKNNHADKGIYINPDSIRKDICGNVSDQSQNTKVWKIAYDRLKTACEDGVEEIWFDATSLHNSSIRAVLQIASLYKQDVEIYIMNDSFNKELCRSRVRSDIENGVDRSNVPDEVIDKQFENFKSLIDNLEEYRKGWHKEFPNINISVVYK